MNLSTSPDELKAYAYPCRAADMRVYWVLSPEAEEWIKAFGERSTRFHQHVAGSVRVRAWEAPLAR
jgi:hypothetical protein